MWVESLEMLPYEAPQSPGKGGGGGKGAAAAAEALAAQRRDRMSYTLDDLELLLRLGYHRFWSQVRPDTHTRARSPVAVCPVPPVLALGGRSSAEARAVIEQRVMQASGEREPRLPCAPRASCPRTAPCPQRTAVPPRLLPLFP